MFSFLVDVFMKGSAENLLGWLPFLVETIQNLDGVVTHKYSQETTQTLNMSSFAKHTMI